MKLFRFTDEAEHEYGKQGRRKTRVGRRCRRCGSPIPPGEGAVYDESGLCGWCDHMYQKLLTE